MAEVALMTELRVEGDSKELMEVRWAVESSWETEKKSFQNRLTLKSSHWEKAAAGSGPLSSTRASTVKAA